MPKDVTNIQRSIRLWMQQQHTRIITDTEAATLLGCTRQQAYKLCVGLCRSRWLISIGTNHFTLNPAIQPNTIPTPHPLHVGSFLIKPYYLSYHTALAYHGFTQPIPSPIYIATTKNRGHLHLGDCSYRIVCISPQKFFGYTPVTIEGRTIQMADREKTFIDSLEKFWYAGGIVNVIEILTDTIDTLDVTRLVDYAVHMQSSTLIQRIGYLLDQFDVCFNDDFLLSYARRNLCYLDPFCTCDMKPERNEKWNIMVNVPDSSLLRVENNTPIV